MSVFFASPGPFTTQPIIERVKGVVRYENFFSSFATVSITGKPWRAQDGQEIIVSPLFLIPNDFNISKPTLISGKDAGAGRKAPKFMEL